jgi:GT2 family glycosyltransferase
VPSSLPELTPAAVCAITVTYKPDDFSLQTIRTIVEEAAPIVILANHSGEASLQKLRTLKGDKVTLVEGAENTGIDQD